MTTPQGAPTQENFFTTFVYNKLGQLTQQIDALNVVTQYQYDPLRRLNVTIENYVSGSAFNDRAFPDRNVRMEFGYDPVGNLLTATVPPGATTSIPAGNITYAYDLLNRQTGVDHLLPGTTDVWTYVYDKAHRETSMLDPNGDTRALVYDALDRVSNMNYTDTLTPDVTFTYDILGNRDTMVDGWGTTNFDYDGMNRLTQVTDPQSRVVSYGYDLGGRRTQFTMPGNRQATYQYDVANRLTTVSDWDVNTSDVVYGYFNQHAGDGFCGW